MAKKNDSDQSNRRGAQPSETDPIPRVKLPESLQKQVDDEETLLDQVYDGTYARRAPEWNCRASGV